MPDLLGWGVSQPCFTDTNGQVYLLDPRHAQMCRVLVALAPRTRRYVVGELTLRFNGESVEAMVSEWLSARSLGNLALKVVG